MAKYIRAEEFGAWFKKLIGDQKVAKVARILGIERPNVYRLMDTEEKFTSHFEMLKKLGLTPLYRIDNPPDFSQPDPADQEAQQAAEAKEAKKEKKRKAKK